MSPSGENEKKPSDSAAERTADLDDEQLDQVAGGGIIEPIMYRRERPDHWKRPRSGGTPTRDSSTSSSAKPKPRFGK